MKTTVTYLSDDHVASLTSYTFEEPTLNQAAWTPEKRPAILVVPGGGYAYCSEREADPAALAFSGAGYQTFVLKYHCGDASAYPTPLIEIAQACALVRKQNAEYHIDPNKIAIIGFSAGGHLAALLGSSWYQKSLQALTWLDEEEMRPNAILLGYPLVHLRAFAERLRAADVEPHARGAMIRDYAPQKDPLALVGEATPPTFIFHTLTDPTILPMDTLEYVNALVKNNVPCEYHLFSAGEHGLSTADSLSCYGREYPHRVHHWVPMALAWLNELFQWDW